MRYECSAAPLYLGLPTEAFKGGSGKLFDFELGVLETMNLFPKSIVWGAVIWLQFPALIFLRLFNWGEKSSEDGSWRCCWSLDDTLRSWEKSSCCRLATDLPRVEVLIWSKSSPNSDLVFKLDRAWSPLPPTPNVEIPTPPCNEARDDRRFIFCSFCIANAACICWRTWRRAVSWLVLRPKYSGFILETWFGEKLEKPDEMINR